ncbi:DUF4365 domain-containing protein [Nocardia niwae]|uniref:DUF4365 domain-containing protein n=1 Tax=Nocardia niwae TaxID=626084 RepID=A0ABV2X5E1_9NOCA
MVRRPASAQTASAGVTQTRHAVETGMRWIFREQPFEDYGIDAHIEVVDDETVLGRLVALQIKAGRSYFDSPAAGGGWWFRDDAMHFKYWLDFSIPVVIVLVDLEDRLCYWQLVTESTVEKSNGSQWKLRVPETHLLDGSAVQPLRDAAVKGIRQARREPGAPVTTFAAADLEVHSALAGADVLPEYIVRAHDRELDELVANAMGSAARSACKVLIGGSCTGKTRALYEALHRRGTDPGRASLAEAGWRVWPEVNPLPPRRFLDELKHVGPRTIVWLNEAQRYLRDPGADVRTEIATALLELIADDSRAPVLVLGTLWPEHWQELTHRPETAEADRFAAARRLLNGNYLRVPESFTNAEVTMARQSGNPLLTAAASRVTGTAITQELAGTPDLLQRYETASAASQAVVHAVMDARRFGHGEWFPETFLAAIARCYLTGADRQSTDDDPSWFGAAVANLIVPGPASGPVLHRNLLGYRLDDFLDETGRVQRRFEFPPAEFWTVVAETETHSDSKIQMADGAADRLRLRIAAHLYETAGSAAERLHELAEHFERWNVPDAAERLARLAANAGMPQALTSLARPGRRRSPKSKMALLRQAANLGDLEAFEWLVSLLEEAGEKESAESVAREATELGSWRATVSIAECRDFDSPDEAEQMIRDLPVEMRWDAMAALVDFRDSVDDFEGAEQLAMTLAGCGHLDALLGLADERQHRGDKEAARRLLARVPQPKTPEDTLRMALSHAWAGAHDAARELLAGLSGARHLDDQVAAIADAWPQLIRSLHDVLTALGERIAAHRLIDQTEQPRESMPSDGDDLPPDFAEEDEEVATAYATLAGFHARRGEFEEAEPLAMAASELGNSTGLVTLGQELLQRGDHATAERLALCAINTPEWSPLSGSPAAGRTLAEARGDESLLVWGLEADGTTAKPW